MPESLRSAPGRFAQGRFHVAQHKTPLGPVDRRVADPYVRGDFIIMGTGIGCEQDLGSLHLAHGRLAALEQGLQLLALGLAQLHSVSYIHGCSSKKGETRDESKP